MITLEYLMKDYEDKYLDKRFIGIERDSPEYWEDFGFYLKHTFPDVYTRANHLDYEMKFKLSIMLAAYIFFFEEDGMSEDSDVTRMLVNYIKITEELNLRKSVYMGETNEPRTEG